MRKYLKEGQYSIDESDVLGKGSFGRVYRGYDHTNAKWVAIKSIDLDVLEKYGDEMKTIICNEITVMRKFTKKMKEKPCHYLVKHEDCFRTDQNIHIVMELCQGGTLNDLLKDGAIHENTVKVILKHLLAGLVYLDELSISHRDLKPENIFISHQFNDGVNETYYKIGDFGFSAQKQSFNQILGTYPFMAPQIYNRQNYTSKVDVWSLGIITYQLLFNDLYFFGKNKWQIEKKVKQTPFVLTQNQKTQISPQMQEFMSACLIKDQSKRPIASELLLLPLFSDKDKQVGFEAIQCELQYSQFLRTMAQKICEFGNKYNHRSEFIQIYFLKKAYSIINLLAYSVMNKQNYINMDAFIHEWMIIPFNSARYQELDQKIQKECILVTSMFKSKFQEFTKYIEKFSQDQQSKIKAIIAPDEIYIDINEEIYKRQLKKWIGVLSLKTGDEELKLKCQKLYEI